MGEMRRAIAHEDQERRKQDRFASTIVIAASIIAAVRLAREEISRPSPRLTSVIADSVGLAHSGASCALRIVRGQYGRRAVGHKPPETPTR